MIRLTRHQISKSIKIIENITDEKEDLQTLISAAKSKTLDLAIHGQLVPQNPDDEPASVLLERIRAEKKELIKQGKIKRDKKESVIFKGEDNSYYEKIGKSVSKIDAEIPFALPEGWEWCKLGSLCSSIQYGLSNSAESSETHKLLRRITDIQNGSGNWDTVPYTTIEDPETFCFTLYYHRRILFTDFFSQSRCRNQGLQIFFFICNESNCIVHYNINISIIQS